MIFDAPLVVDEYNDDRMIDGAQIRAARALLGIKQSDLAKAADLSEAVIKNVERGKGDTRSSTLVAIENAFHDLGVTFIDNAAASPDGGRGVRFTERRQRVRLYC